MDRRYRDRRYGGGQGEHGQSRHGEMPYVEDQYGRHEPARGPYAGGGSPRADAYRSGAGPTADHRASRAPRGPKGYQRSDERIREDVCDSLMRHAMYSEELDPSNVSVEVRDATVVLEGTVPERWMRHAIEDIAAHRIGVKDVANRVLVQPFTAAVPLPEADATPRRSARRH